MAINLKVHKQRASEPDVPDLDPGLIYLAAILDAIPDGVSVHSQDGIILAANRSLAEICGSSSAGMVGKNCADFFHSGALLCPHVEVLETGQPSRQSFEHKSRRFSVTIAPVGQGSPGYVRVIREEAGQKPEADIGVKVGRAAVLEQMISGVAHDVGTPLGIISGYSEYLLMRTRPEDAGYKELSTILQQTRRISEFIKHMLDLTRSPKGRVDAIALKGFLIELLSLMGHHLRKAGVKAVVECEIQPPIIYGDAPRLRQALFTLFINAARLSGPGSTLRAILDQPPGEQRCVRLKLASVDQNGIGFDFSGFPGLQGSDPPADSDVAGLTSTREILDCFGAEVICLNASAGIGKDTGGLGLPLAVSFPAGRNDSALVQAPAHASIEAPIQAEVQAPAHEDAIGSTKG